MTNPFADAISGFGNTLAGNIREHKRENRLKGLLEDAGQGDTEALAELAHMSPHSAQVFMNQAGFDQDSAQQAAETEEAAQQEKLVRMANYAIQAKQYGDVSKSRAYLQSVLNQEQDEDVRAELIDTLNMDDDSLLFDLDSAVSVAQANLGELIQLPQGSKPTSTMQNAMFAFPGNEQAQRSAVAKSFEKTPATTINLGEKNKFQEKLSELNAKTVGRITEEADAAIDMNQSLKVLQAIDIDSGALEPAKQALAKFAEGFGIDASGLAEVSKGESFNAEAQKLVLAVKSSQKGPQTDKDEATIRKTIASLGNSVAGNQFIIDSAMALNNRRIERKSFYDAYIQKHDGNFKDDKGKTADSAWAEYKRKTPLLSSKHRTPAGLPVFFYKWAEKVKEANPDATPDQLLKAWQEWHED